MVEYNVLKDLVPKSQRSSVTPELVDKINAINNDPLLAETFKENILGYTSVLKTGKYKMEDYVNAVKFVSYKVLGRSDIDCYAITFPDRYNKLIEEGLDRNAIAPYVSKYNSNKLVTSILEQTLVPSHIINAPLYQEALNELASIMVNGRSEMARVNAATSILTHTKAPETTKIELDIGLKENDAIADLRAVTQELAKQQRLAIESGVSSSKDIAHSNIIIEETIDVEVVSNE